MNASSDSMTSSRLLDLPAEIRVLIYENLILVDTEDDLEYRDQEQTFHFETFWVCKLIRNEALSFFVNRHSWIQLSADTSMLDKFRDHFTIKDNILPAFVYQMIQSRLMLSMKIDPLTVSLSDKDTQYSSKYIIFNSRYLLTFGGKLWSFRPALQRIEFDFKDVSESKQITSILKVLPLMQGRAQKFDFKGIQSVPLLEDIHASMTLDSSVPNHDNLLGLKLFGDQLFEQGLYDRAATMYDWAVFAVRSWKQSPEGFDFDSYDVNDRFKVALAPLLGEIFVAFARSVNGSARSRLNDGITCEVLSKLVSQQQTSDDWASFALTKDARWQGHCAQADAYNLMAQACEQLDWPGYSVEGDDGKEGPLQTVEDILCKAAHHEYFAWILDTEKSADMLKSFESTRLFLGKTEEELKPAIHEQHIPGYGTYTGDPRHVAIHIRYYEITVPLGMGEIKGSSEQTVKKTMRKWGVKESALNAGLLRTFVPRPVEESF